jgi:hypothetical protein
VAPSGNPKYDAEMAILVYKEDDVLPEIEAVAGLGMYVVRGKFGSVRNYLHLVQAALFHVKHACDRTRGCSTWARVAQSCTRCRGSTCCTLLPLQAQRTVNVPALDLNC